MFEDYSLEITATTELFKTDFHCYVFLSLSLSHYTRFPVYIRKHKTQHWKSAFKL